MAFSRSSTSWSSKTGSSLRYTTSGTESDSTTLTSDYNSMLGVSSGADGKTEDGAALAVGGEATAVGEDTVATGDIDMEIDDRGTTTIANGSATFEASSESDSGDTAYATADTELALSSADHTVAWNIESSSTLRTDDMSKWSASSSIGALAVYEDDQDTRSSGSTTEDDSDGETPLATGESESGGLQPDDDPFTFDYDSGNIAFLDIDAAVYGEDTFISVDGSVLAVEDQISTVTGMVYGAVG